MALVFWSNSFQNMKILKPEGFQSRFISPRACTRWGGEQWARCGGADEGHERVDGRCECPVACVGYCVLEKGQFCRTIELVQISTKLMISAEIVACSDDIRPQFEFLNPDIGLIFASSSKLEPCLRRILKPKFRSAFSFDIMN